jgi:homoserine kinase
MEVIEKGYVVEFEGEGAQELSSNDSNLMTRAAKSVFDRVGRAPAGLKITGVNQIPLSAGLGSSAAAIVAAVAGANVLVDGGLSTGEMLHMAREFEGHGDNAAASLFGGLNLVTEVGDTIVARQVPVPSLRLAIASPNFGLSTNQMREALPPQIPLKDAALNVGRALLTVEALRSGDYALLARVMTDRLHERVRSRHIPGFDKVVEAARQAGAAAVTLSGAGPSLVAFAPSGHEKIAQVMVQTWSDIGVSARKLVLHSTELGVTSV